jgi:hypothetical protein
MHDIHGGPPTAVGPASAASMTCAGLLGLAVAYGVVGERADEKEKPKETDKDKEKDPKAKDAPLPDMTKDAILVRGIAALSTAVGVPAEKLQAMGKPAVIPKIGGQSYYFLWSLERVCMALDLDTIGGKDWYSWGAEILIANQTADGSWQADYAHYKADTCFALLFLRRANFARDLSARLKGKLDQKALRGGVGAEGLKEKLGGGLTKPGEGAADTKATAESKEGERLAREVVDAKGERQEQLLSQLRDAKGRQHTDAMLIAIAQLGADAKKSARRMLAERLAKEGKESADKLTDYLDDRDVEVRRAESRMHVPVLIGLLRDREPLVARAAWAALKNMTKQDFGPALDATDEDKDKAVKAWRAWWEKNK